MPRQITDAPMKSTLATAPPLRRARRSRRLLAIAPVGAALVLAACGGAAASNSPAPAAPAAPAGSTAAANPAAPATGIQISVRSSQYGRILSDGTNHTVYLFTHDRSTPSTCYGGCSNVWPPVLTKGVPTAGSGLNARLLGTTHRTDGTLQVTYGGHPLYYYVNDVKAGQILCQNVDEFGGTWLVVSPSGTAVR